MEDNRATNDFSNLQYKDNQTQYNYDLYDYNKYIPKEYNKVNN